MAEPPTMSITFVLDLSESVAGWLRTFESIRSSAPPGSEVVVVWVDSEGFAVGERAAELDGRARSVRSGSGPGVARWREVAQSCSGDYLVFVRPGDEVLPLARAALQQACEGCHDWLVGAWEGSAYSDWWQRHAISPESAGALLALGANLEESSVLVRRSAWLELYSGHPELRQTPQRAPVWLALSLRSKPAIVPEVLSRAVGGGRCAGSEQLAGFLAGQVGTEALLREILRLGAGLRMGYRELLLLLSGPTRWLGSCEGSFPRVWDGAADLLNALFHRGQRAIWIWGAGQRGGEALHWLRQRNMPVVGFLDSDTKKEGQRIGDIPVVLGQRFLSEVASGPERPIVVIGSMYHMEIGRTLRQSGFEPGKDYGNFDLPAFTTTGAADGLG